MKKLTLKYQATCRDHPTPHPLRQGDVAYGSNATGRWRFICEDAYWGNQFAEQERDQERQAFEAEYQQGIALARHLRDTRNFLGEQAAIAEELAWESRLGYD